MKSTIGKYMDEEGEIIKDIAISDDLILFVAVDSQKLIKIYEKDLKILRNDVSYENGAMRVYMSDYCQNKW